MVNKLGDPLLRSDKFSSYYPIAPSRLVFPSVTHYSQKRSSWNSLSSGYYLESAAEFMLMFLDKAVLYHGRVTRYLLYNSLVGKPKFTQEWSAEEWFGILVTPCIPRAARLSCSRLHGQNKDQGEGSEGAEPSQLSQTAWEHWMEGWNWMTGFP